MLSDLTEIVRTIFHHSKLEAEKVIKWDDNNGFESDLLIKLDFKP